MNLKTFIAVAFILFAISSCKKEHPIQLDKNADQTSAKTFNACTDAQLLWEGERTNSSVNGVLRATSLVVDKFNNIIVAGLYRGTVDFDPGAGVFNLTGGGGFLYKIGPDGRFLKAIRIPMTEIPPGEVPGINALTDLDTDVAGNTYLTFSEYIADGTPRPIRIIKLDKNGAIGYNILFYKKTFESVRSAVDSHGNLFTVGRSSQNFVEKRDENGNLIYSQGGLSLGEYGTDVIIDYQNNLHVVSGYSIVGSSAYIYRKYNSNGKLLTDLSAWDSFRKPATDTLGHTYMIRSGQGGGELSQCSNAGVPTWHTRPDGVQSVVFKCTKAGDLYYILRAPSYYTFNLVKYNVNGTIVWSKTVPVIGSTHTGVMMEPDQANNIIIVTNNGQNQIRLAKYQVCR
ncbi:MAG: hypothetical protein ABIP28_10755 [Mucilaginibacter sp.]